MIDLAELPNGLMVDRVRSAYASTWNFPANPDVQGQYYFVPEGTAPFDSFAWSGNVRDREKEPAYSLGPISDVPQYWVRGDAPVSVCVPPWEIGCSGARVPTRLKVDVGPVLDAACDDCEVIAGIQTMTKLAAFCRWDGPPLEFCGNAFDPPLRYFYNVVHDPDISRTAFSFRKIGSLGPTFLLFGQTFEPWDFWSPLTIPLTIVDPDTCVDYPTEVTITPAD